MSTINRPPVGYIAPAPDSPLGRVTVRSTDGRYTLTALMGQTLPTISDGRGGWSEVARDRRPAVLQWDGPAAEKVTLELFLDRWASGGEVSGDVATIDALCPRGPTVEPPVVYVSGVPVLSSTTPYVINSAVPSDWLLRRDGRVARCTYTLELLQYRVGDVVVRNSPAKAAASKAKTSRSKAKTHVVKRGETLGSLAAQFLGSASKWKQIADAQSPKLRDPNHLKAGQKITLP